MNRKWIALLLGIIVIGAWGLVFALMVNQPQDELPVVLPTLASLPTPAPMQRVSPTEDTADIVPDAVPHQVVVQFALNASDAERADYVAAVGGEIVDSIPALNAVVLNLPDSEVMLEPSLLVVASEPDYLVSALIDVPTSDTYFDQQWGLDVIGAPQVWSSVPSETSALTVAVVDSGICASHPDLSGRIGPGFDFVENDTTPQDVAGHGCAVSGVIAANIDNGLGIAGVAPNAQIMPLRVLDAQGIGTYSDVAAALVYAVDHGASIINLSLGGPNTSSLLANAVNYAATHDVMVVAAAGNTGTTGVLYPAAYESVVAVGAVDASLQRSSFSTYGPEIDALAPGRDILTTHIDGEYALFSGTSLAAPHVAGVAVLEMARGNTLVFDGGIVTVGEVAQPPTPQPVAIPPEYDDLYNKAVNDGQLRLIVGLNAPFQAQALQNDALAQAQQVTITQVRQALVDQLEPLSGATVMVKSQDWIVPYLAVKADAEAVAFLANSPDVVSIQEDQLKIMSLARSTPHIDADNAWSLGHDGSGQTVAILDGGTEAGHDFFDGRVVEEACFSNFWELENSLCPNNQTIQIGAGAAATTRCNLFTSPCDHGTHVAGIAAGNNGVVQAPSGVAKGANIIAIQVFTGVSDCSNAPGAQPCIGSYDIDQVQGLFRVYELRHTYDIAAVNMSLGGASVYNSASLCDSDNSFIKDYIDALRAENIATIIASGNEYQTNGISAPACVSSAISVGSVGTAFYTGPMNDTVSSFSNSANILDLLAPGGYIYSASTGNSYAWIAGTSMATPHVTGAWAVLKQAAPDATVTEILNALTSTGVPVTDYRNGIIKPRIDLDNALSVLVPPELVVNSTNDVGDGVCDVTHCSLRDALTATNSTTDIREIVTFDIGGGGQQTIVLDGANGPLPIITDPVVIDGRTQPGYSGAPLIELDGTNIDEALDPTEVGINITAGNSVVRGLVINNFGYGGIGLTLMGDNIVSGNYVGTEPDGVTPAPNLYGVIVCSSDDNLIGGTASEDRNIISGNNDDGINICQVPGQALATDNTVQGNIIGLDVTGTVDIGNGDDGIKIEDATNTLIGGTLPGAGNVISGNLNGGVTIIGPAATGQVIQGNIIGPNAAGTQAFAGNTSNDEGIRIQDSSNNLIGGTSTAARNLISGNLQGIWIEGQSGIGGSHNNIIQGNFIGTDISGTASLPNQNQFGINLGENGMDDVTNTIVGGTAAAAANVISGNQGYGLFVYGNSNTIQGNFIGTDLSGTLDLGNGVASGVTLDGNNNIVGGTAPGTGNIIAYNTGYGVAVGYNSTVTGNAILGNRIFGTTAHPNPNHVGLGIDLSINGTVSNDEDDVDSGNNNLQNHPVITSADATANTLTLNGTLNSTPNSSFRVELFLNNTCDPSGNGEGEFFLTGLDGVTTDGSGDASFDIMLNQTVSAGQQITATATDAANNTSEFSACESIVQDPNVLVVNTTSTTLDNTCNGSHCSLRDAIAIANATGGTQTIQFWIGGGGQQTIRPTTGSMWADVTDTLIIDGTTQPGYAGTPLIELDGVNTNSTSGLNIFADNSVVRGLAVNNFRQYGIEVRGTSIAIESNYLGLAPDGVTAKGNHWSGVQVALGNNNTIGIGNLISGNGGSGVYVSSSAAGTQILGNTIGIDSNNSPLANGANGIEIGATTSTNINGNLVGGNAQNGVLVNGATNTTIDNNFLGVGPDSITAIANGNHGVEIINNGSNNQIGGSSINLIYFNSGDGIHIESGTQNLIRHNQISGNGGLGIDLGPDGVTPNDDLDADSGANNLLNAVVLTEVVSPSNIVTGMYDGEPNTTLILVFYRDDQCDPSGYGEGKLFSGPSDVEITTDAGGHVEFNIDLGEALLTGQVFTARVTDPNNNTSEFSNCLEIADARIAMPNHFIATLNSEIDIELTWTDESIDETQWLLERSLAGQNDWTQIADIATADEAGTGGGVTYDDTDFLCSQSYDYRLRAFNQPGDYYSLYTPVVNATPTCPALVVPGSFAATALSRSQIDLSWDDTNTTETAYVVEHSADGGLNWDTLVTLPPDTTSYSHTGLSCLTTHSYQMRTVRDHQGPFSDYTAVQTTATDPCPALVAPINPVATALSRNQIQFSWTESAPGEVTNYHVERSSDGAIFGEISSVPGHVTSIVDGNLACGQTYYYRVRSARAEDGSMSPYSSVVSATTNACPVAVEHTVGLYRDGVWQFWDVNQNTQPAITFAFGPRQSGWQPVVGDWDGDGTDGIGLYRDGVWLLRNASSAGPIDLTFAFGPRQSGWQPVVGDWDGDGTDGIGLYKDGLFQLRQTGSSGSPEMTFAFGQRQSGWQAVAGDWNHSGNDSVGLYKDGLWMLSNSLPARSDIAPFTFGQTQAGWSALAGDWNNDGTMTIGVYQNRLWQLRNGNSNGSPDIGYSFPSGQGAWQPLASYRGGLGGLTLLAMEPVSPTTAPVQPSATPTLTVEATADDVPEVEATPTAEATAEVTEEVASPTIEATATVTASATAAATFTATATVMPPTMTLEPPSATPEPPTATATPQYTPTWTPTATATPS